MIVPPEKINTFWEIFHQFSFWRFRPSYLIFAPAIFQKHKILNLVLPLDISSSWLFGFWHGQMVSLSCGPRSIDCSSPFFSILLFIFEFPREIAQCNCIWYLIGGEKGIPLLFSIIANAHLSFQESIHDWFRILQLYLQIIKFS